MFLQVFIFNVEGTKKAGKPSDSDLREKVMGSDSKDENPKIGSIHQVLEKSGSQVNQADRIYDNQFTWLEYPSHDSPV